MKVRNEISQLFKDYENLARETGNSYHTRLQGIAKTLDVIGLILQGQPEQILKNWQEIYAEDKMLAGK